MNRKLFLIGLSLLTVVSLVVLLYRELAPKDNQAAQSCGIVAYDWNKPVPKSLSGFPRLENTKNEIPHNNDWTKPVNYAEGTLYYRAQIKSQPKPKDMRLQVCFWQSRPGGSAFDNENCGPLKDVKGTAGNVVTWSAQVQAMWKKDGIIIDWTRPRHWVGVAVKNTKGDPVSNFSGWNWNGENPDEWYPLDMRFTTVVVPKGGTFCGWDYYLTGATPPPNSPTTSQTPSSTPTPNPSAPPTNTPIPGISPTVSPSTIGSPVPTATSRPATTAPTTNIGQPTSSTVQGNICGKGDIDSNGIFTIADFTGFAQAYGNGKNTCADKDVNYGACGGRDVNRDGSLNIFDFGAPGVGFAQRYYPKTSCAL